MAWIFNTLENYGFPAILILFAFLIAKFYFRYKTQTEDVRKLKNEEIRLLSETLANETPYKIFLLEQLFETKYGRSMSWREISFLMKLASPSEAMSLYADSFYFVDFPYEEISPTYRGHLKSDKYRKSRKSWNVICYFIMSAFGLLGLWLTPWIYVHLEPAWGMVFLSFVIVMVMTAIFCLRGYSQILKAERLMKLIKYSKANPDKARERSYLLIRS